MYQLSELQKVIYNCKVAPILWIKSKKDLILRSFSLIAYQTGAQANFFFKHHCMKNCQIFAPPMQNFDNLEISGCLYLRF